MMPSRYLQPKPAHSKPRQSVNIKHISAPLKGLSLSSKLVTGDPLTASVLDNWVIEENQIRCRPGVVSSPLGLIAPAAIEQLVPYYGSPNKLSAAGAGKIVLLDNTLVKSGFGSNDWSWTAFTNLSTTDYTVMVNGVDGVWSWDGGTVQAPAPVVVTSVSNANPAVVTVGVADITKFVNGQVVLMAGVTGGGMTVANGLHIIGSVGAPANTFVLVGVDTSTGAAPATVGITAAPPGSMQKELVTAPPTAAPWLSVNQLVIVMAHMNRLFFADTSNLAFYYLPIQQKSGELKVFPLNAIFKRGGTIRAMYTWTTEGATNLNDQLVVFTSNGEAAIFGGVDPDTDFELSGLFRFDAPMSKHSVVNYGGELYVLISTGLVPMSTLMRAESEQLGQSDRNVFSTFFQTSLQYRDRPGWSVLVNPTSGRVICNMPQGGKVYSQMVRFMPNPIWASWSNLRSRCWGWVDNRLFFGSDDGRVYEMHPNFLNDDGVPIRVDVQAAWSNYGTPLAKQFKMILPYLQTDGTPRPYVDIKVDYDMTPPTNQPDVTFSDDGARWDTATWDLDPPVPPHPPGDFWAQSAMGRNYWSGVGVIGRVGGPRLVALVDNAQFSLTGWDVMFETGSPLG